MRWATAKKGAKAMSKVSDWWLWMVIGGLLFGVGVTTVASP